MLLHPYNFRNVTKHQHVNKNYPNYSSKVTSYYAMFWGICGSRKKDAITMLKRKEGIGNKKKQENWEKKGRKQYPESTLTYTSLQVGYKYIHIIHMPHDHLQLEKSQRIRHEHTFM